MTSNRPSEPDAAEEYVRQIEHEGYDALRRALLERYRVNIGLVAENAELKRKLRGPRTLSDPDQQSGASPEGNDGAPGAAA